MIPRIDAVSPLQRKYLAFVDALREDGFRGDINIDYANRVVQATDNSIYQILPQGALYPRDTADLVRVARLSDRSEFRDVVLSPRGGGTGTNGQSLSDGLIVDVSKYMNRILEINVDDRWVRVQAGVVKDQLNDVLQPYGLFFAPELSPSNRATIGGMINTDACGQGSCRYGKTRDHVLELESVFLDGTVWTSRPVDAAQLDVIKKRSDRVGAVHRVTEEIVRDNASLIEERFPKLNRCLTGYDLAHVNDRDGRFDLNSILCGAEGTLAFVAEAKLNLTPLPRHLALVNVKYSEFEDTLRDTQELMRFGPAAIESIDSIVLELAMKDIVWDSVKDLFPTEAGKHIRGVNLVEFIAEDEEELRKAVTALTDRLDAVGGQPRKCFGYTVAYGNAQIKRVWSMRKKAVGLLGNVKGDQRPIPFVEDTAVPPENLADYIMEFRAILEREGLAYGMFGHVDAGVLHVRPAIDMKDPQQETLIRKISDEVTALTRKYKGLLWGEHGKGLRSEYAPEFFGPLYPCLQSIKRACDPRNQLNPGKISTPTGSDSSLSRIDGVATRGQHDRQIPITLRQEYAAALDCNGNGACFNFDPHDQMCPSWKGTRERIHSPKGRASLVREWLRLLAAKNVDPLDQTRSIRRRSALSTIVPRVRNSLARRAGEYDFSHEVQHAMNGCLACKCCSTQCPIRVDVPDFRSKFFELYYGRYLRPARHHAVARLEAMLPWLRPFSGAYNFAMTRSWVQRALRDHVGLVDNPTLTGLSVEREARRLGVSLADTTTLNALSPAQKAKAVIVVQDAFTSFFETELLLDILKLLKRVGFFPLVARFVPNGKPLQVHGFLGGFHRVARRNARHLQLLASHGVPMVGVDPSMTLTYRSEYAHVVDEDERPRVHLLQEWMAQQAVHLSCQVSAVPKRHFKLLAHCTEKTTAGPSMRSWQTVFHALGHSLEIVEVGCCGMAGTYGHEAEHAATSRRIYGLSWADVVDDPSNEGLLVATGYSCRSQVKRISGRPLSHPLQALLKSMQVPSVEYTGTASLPGGGGVVPVCADEHGFARGCCD